ncbi:MAG: inorganic diphosphatase [Candidatus Gracilibacteria bacterium]|nr:inorganic diphosphatase [Candidatus Gracilibacteria bacterium]MDD2908395.1 inorganic diphosphatase [Candidatus Gracilibacteria bacterium]
MDNSKDFLGKEITIKIDRPLNSNHPKHGFKYELNYGYVPNTISGDSEELDAYVLGVNEVIEEFNGKCIAVIHRTNDDDDKLIVVPIGAEFTDEEIRNLTNFQEQYFKSIIIR